MNTLTMLNSKKKTIVFNSINFNLKFLNSIQIQLCYIQFKIHYANSFNIKSLKWNLIFLQESLIFFINSSSLVMHINMEPKLYY
jgi:hypothetical protein